MVRKTKDEIPKTTSQELGSLIKSAMLTWIMFLKFLDDMERIKEAEEELAGRRFKSSVEPIDGGTGQPKRMASQGMNSSLS